MVLGLAASENIVNLGVAETSVQGGAFEGRAVFLFQFLADADIPLQPVAVGDAFAVVVHAVEDEVTMGIGGVVVADYDILSVLDSHLFHILLCKQYHKLIGQAWLVLRLETDGYMADWFDDPWVLSWDWISKHLAVIFGLSGMMPSWAITSA